MRIAIALLLFCVTLPSQAQERIFHASSIDLEQNDRLAAIEARLDELECQPDVVQSTNPVPMQQPKQSSPSTILKPYAVITIETLPGCQPCQRWKAKEAKELRANGWTVTEAPLTSSRSAPYFRICIGDKCYSHSGFMSHSVLRSIIDKTNSKATQTTRKIVQSARYTTEQLRSKIRSLRPGGWRGPVYADVSPRSYAKQHLCGPEHGFTWEQVAGLSQEEALILHDLAPRHGNQIFPQP
jgi:hypothetical protein